MLNKHRALVVLTCLIFLMTLGACETEVDNQPAAAVGEAVEVAEPSPAAESVTVDVIEEESRIDWVGAKVTGQHDGGFREFDGSLTFSGDMPQSVIFTIDTTSVWSDTDRLTNHLKSDDFFDVENHPTAHFESSSIREIESPEGDTYEITGNLAMRGMTNSITFPATVDMSGDTIEANAEFTLDRQLWGVSYKGAPDNLIRDDVLIRLALRFPKPGAEPPTAGETPAEGDDTADSASPGLEV